MIPFYSEDSFTFSLTYAACDEALPFPGAHAKKVENHWFMLSLSTPRLAAHAVRELAQ